MAGFFKMFKRLNFNLLGVVTCSDFRNGKLPHAYLGKGEKENKGKLMIYGEKLDDYVFDKSDIVSANIIAQEIVFPFNGKRIVGPKYEVKFKDGKIAIFCVGSARAYKIDSIIF